MPTTVPIRKYFIFTTNKSYYFTISRNSNGTWQHNKSWKRDYSKEAKTIAERYIESSIDQSIDNIVKTFNYPKTFTSEQLIKDVRALSKAVKIITYHLGNIVSYKINDSLLNYRYFVIQSATQEYWNKYPHFNTLIYHVKYSKKGSGYRMFRFSIIDYVLVLNSILYNLLEENPEAETIFKNIESNIRNELGNKYQTIANDSMH